MRRLEGNEKMSAEEFIMTYGYWFIPPVAVAIGGWIYLMRRKRRSAATEEPAFMAPLEEDGGRVAALEAKIAELAKKLDEKPTVAAPAKVDNLNDLLKLKIYEKVSASEFEIELSGEFDEKLTPAAKGKVSIKKPEAKAAALGMDDEVAG